MGAKLQNWVNKNIYDFSARGYDGLPTINGSLLQSILDAGNFSEETVTVRRALKISTVFTCLNVRGKTISSLPINVIQETGDKKEVLTDHPAYYLLSQQPNSYLSSANFFLTSMLHADAWGNSFAYITRDSRNRPTSLDLWNPWEVSISFENGMPWYTYKGETVPGRDVLHFRWYSFDGICGRSPIMENANTMGMAIKLDRYSAITIGSRPPGILSYEGTLTPEQRAENKKEWGAGALSDVKILSGRWKFDSVITPPEDAQYIQAKNLNRQEICGIYQVPPTFIQNFERATYTNAEQSDLVYAKHTITPIIRMIEQECNMKLFYEREKANTYVKFNLNGLLRGDLAARQAFYQSMVNTGVMMRNEARSYEDLNGYEGGDVPLVQGAMIPGDQEGIDALRTKMAQETIPSAKPINGKHVNGHGVLN